MPYHGSCASCGCSRGSNQMNATILHHPTGRKIPDLPPDYHLSHQSVVNNRLCDICYKKLRIVSMEYQGSLLQQLSMPSVLPIPVPIPVPDPDPVPIPIPNSVPDIESK